MEETKPIHLNKNYHTALAVHRKETGATMRFVVHLALRMYFERYAPELVPVLKGEEPDERMALDDFESKDIK